MIFLSPFSAIPIFPASCYLSGRGGRDISQYVKGICLPPLPHTVCFTVTSPCKLTFFLSVWLFGEFLSVHCCTQAPVILRNTRGKNETTPHTSQTHLFVRFSFNMQHRPQCSRRAHFLISASARISTPTLICATDKLFRGISNSPYTMQESDNWQKLQVSWSHREGTGGNHLRMQTVASHYIRANIHWFMDTHEECLFLNFSVLHLKSQTTLGQDGIKNFHRIRQ